MGTMDPVIEIWDLDVMESIGATYELGSKKEKKKKKQKQKAKQVRNSALYIRDLSLLVGRLLIFSIKNLLSSAKSDNNFVLSVPFNKINLQESFYVLSTCFI